MYEGWDSFKPKVMALEVRLNQLGVEMCACHNDAVPENFIKGDDGTIYLIDWEYSGMNDPLADFAALFIESTLISAVVGVFGASALWGIGELFEQKKRVERGWFPQNPKREKK